MAFDESSAWMLFGMILLIAGASFGAAMIYYIVTRRDKH